MQKLIICAGKNENFSFATSIGVGMIAPCIYLTELILAKKPEQIIFIGSCGLYDRQKELLKIYESYHAFNVEFSKLENGFYSPANCEVNVGQNLTNSALLPSDENGKRANKKLNLQESLQKLSEILNSNFKAKESKIFKNSDQNMAFKKANLSQKTQEFGRQKNNVSHETFISNSSNYICANSKAAAKFQALGLDLENMEIFSILSIAKYFDIKATCFLCASNYCDEKAHESFLKNHLAVKKNLENFLQEKNYI